MLSIVLLLFYAIEHLFYDIIQKTCRILHHIDAMDIEFHGPAERVCEGMGDERLHGGRELEPEHRIPFIEVITHPAPDGGHGIKSPVLPEHFRSLVLIFRRRPGYRHGHMERVRLHIDGIDGRGYG